MSPLIINKLEVHDSFLFVKEVANFDQNLILAGLVFDSRFTSLILNEAIANCGNNLLITLLDNNIVINVLNQLPSKNYFL